MAERAAGAAHQPKRNGRGVEGPRRDEGEDGGKMHEGRENAISPLVDRCGRPVTYLRVSVTDRCNLRCEYCMPAEGVALVPRSEVLDFEEIVFALRVANRLGIRRFRLTGGEPLLRRDITKLVAMILQECEVDDLAMTTNALLLEQFAPSLKAAGLQRLNISLDSLDDERFAALTRFPLLERAWRGIEAAQRAGFERIKINAVYLADTTEREIDGWMQLVREHPISVRFLELMPIGEGAALFGAGRYGDASALLRRLRDRWELEPAAVSGNGPARYWRLADGRGTLGFITPMSNPYCDTCTRFRLTSTGGLRPCLAHDLEVQLRAAIRRRDAAAVEQGFRRAAAIKPAGHHWRDGATTRAGMSTLGG